MGNVASGQSMMQQQQMQFRHPSEQQRAMMMRFRAQPPNIQQQQQHQQQFNQQNPRFMQQQQMRMQMNAQQQWQRMPPQGMNHPNAVFQNAQAHQQFVHQQRHQIRADTDHHQPQHQQRQHHPAGPSHEADTELPSELPTDEDLFEVGHDFDICEYMDTEGVDTSGKNNIFDELDARDLGCLAEGGDVKPVAGQFDKQTPSTQTGLGTTSGDVPTVKSEPGTLAPSSNVPCAFSKSQVTSAAPPIQQQQPYSTPRPNYDHQMQLSGGDGDRLMNPQQGPTNIASPHPGQPPSQVASYPGTPLGPPPTPSSQMNAQMYSHQQQQQQAWVNQQQQSQQQAARFNRMPYPPPGARMAGPMHRVPMSPNVQAHMQMQQRMAVQQQQQGPGLFRPNSQMPQMMPGHPQSRMAMHGHGQPVQLDPKPPNPVVPNYQPVTSGHPAPPFPAAGDSNRSKYETWLTHQKLFLTKQRAYFDAEIAKLRKLKKSLNAKQRSCRKNQNELNDVDAHEMARVLREQPEVQKMVDLARKYLRQHESIIEEYQKKFPQSIPVNSPGAAGPPPGIMPQASPRPGLSPMGSVGVMGPGNPRTPQSPSIFSQPSPSGSMMLNSPISSMHSPASVHIAPQSPAMHQNPAQTPMGVHPAMGVPSHSSPQIVQDDNNPFSENYMQNEKKAQHSVQQMYPQNHQMDQHFGVENSLPNAMQQQNPYFSQQQQQQQQQFSMRPSGPQPYQSSGHQVVDPNVGFQNRFASNVQQQNPGAYQQSIRRPPPPPYPGNPGGPPPPSSQQMYAVRQQQYRMQQQQQQQQQMIRQSAMNPRLPQQHPQSHMMYDNRMMQSPGSNHPPSMNSNVARGNMSPYGNQILSPTSMHQHQQQQQQQQLVPSQSMTSEAITSMEFTMSEMGSGVNNESVPIRRSKQGKGKKSKPSMSYDTTTFPDDPTDCGAITSIEFSFSGSGSGAQNESDPSSSSTSLHEDNSQSQESQTSFSETSVSLSNSSCQFPVPQTSNSSSEQPEESAVNIKEEPLFQQNDSAVKVEVESTNTEQSTTGDLNKEELSLQQQETNRQNAFLKQLLQNCPSADEQQLQLDQLQQQKASLDLEDNVFDANAVKLEPESTEIEMIDQVPPKTIEEDVKIEHIIPENLHTPSSDVAQSSLPNLTSQTPIAQSPTHSIEQPHFPIPSNDHPPIALNSEPLSHSNASSIPTNSHSSDTGLSPSFENKIVRPQDFPQESYTPNPTSEPMEQKKLSYMEMRRLQLERDPTPPPEEPKPKRKRTVKRKDSSKSVDDTSSMDSSSSAVMNATSAVAQFTNFGGMIPPGVGAPPIVSSVVPQQQQQVPLSKPTKKRNRKGSSTTRESELNFTGTGISSPMVPGGGSSDAHFSSRPPSEATKSNAEHALAKVVSHLRTMPPVQICNPAHRENMNVCLPPDITDLSTKKSRLKGSTFGEGFLPSVDFYSTYPFGPKKPSTTPSSNGHNASSATGTSIGNGRGPYKEEFETNVLLLDVKDTLSDHLQSLPNFLSTDTELEDCSLYVRDADTPETVHYPSSPECCFNDINDEFEYIDYVRRHLFDSEEENDSDERMSPLFFVDPVICVPRYHQNDFQAIEIDKENLCSQNELKRKNSSGYAGGDGLKPLKENGNIGLSLCLTNGQNIRVTLTSLAKMLNLNIPITYSVEKSPDGLMFTETLILDDMVERHCMFCNSLVKNGGGYRKANGDLANIDHDDHNDEESMVAIMDNDSNEAFCNDQCYKDYRMLKTAENPDAVLKMDLKENECLMEDKRMDQEVEKILSEDKEEEMELDERLLNVSEMRWKNERYRHWMETLLDHDKKVTPSDEQLNNGESAESVDDLFNRLSVCLKPAKDVTDFRKCVFCHQVGDGEMNGPSRLLNMDIDKWAHLNCALWSNEAYEMLNGALMNVDQAYLRSLSFHCVSCGQPGASIKCIKNRCNNHYHFPCGLREKCAFFKDKYIYCPTHAQKLGHGDELKDFVVARRVFIQRDEPKQIAAMFHQADGHVMRIGSLIFMNIGQLYPNQLANFHTSSYIYPVGYKVSRFYWSSRRLGKRCQYICSISDVDGRPMFNVEVREENYESLFFEDRSPKLVWQKIIESVAKLREGSNQIKVFTDFISGEDLFGLTEPYVVRILESLPGVDTLSDYNFKYGRSPWYEVFLTMNPTGCARTEGRLRHHMRRTHPLHVCSSSNTARSSIQSSLTSPEIASPYVKQFVHSKVSQYRKMKSEWRNNVRLGRSRIQGLGLYAVRDIEKHTMIIEYIGVLIRNEMAERLERIHEAHVSFRLPIFQPETQSFSFALTEPRCLHVSIGREHCYRCHSERWPGTLH